MTISKRNFLKLSSATIASLSVGKAVSASPLFSPSNPANEALTKFDAKELIEAMLRGAQTKLVV